MPEFSALLKGCTIIGYTPLPGEPSYAAFLKEVEIDGPSSVMSTNRSAPPLMIAADLTAAYAGKKVAVLVPGTAFDAFGTRHGRGGGWYDRFLNAVPAEWLRIGVLDGSRLSPGELVRQKWDEPVDFLLVHRSGKFEILETNARPRR